MGNSNVFKLAGISILFCLATQYASGQGALTLRQAVDQALEQSPQAAIAHASYQEAKSAATLERTFLLPRLNFTEDISRGNDPVYVFGTRLRQGQFTQADLALDALNHPPPMGNFSTRFLGFVDGIRFFQDTARDSQQRSSAGKRFLLRQGG